MCDKRRDTCIFIFYILILLQMYKHRTCSAFELKLYSSVLVYSIYAFDEKELISLYGMYHNCITPDE